MAWPPELTDLKRDLKRGDDDTADDEALQDDLNAAISYVEEQRAGDLNFAADPESTLPDPSDHVLLGTVRLAGRWNVRRNSPDGLVDMGELGQGRVPSVDPDIERMLGIGRWRRPMV